MVTPLIFFARISQKKSVMVVMVTFQLFSPVCKIAGEHGKQGVKYKSANFLVKITITTITLW